MATKNQIRGAMRRKQKAGELPPQKCPNRRCGADLSDPNVPPEYEKYRLMFSQAREVAVNKETAYWVCPVCGHRWQPHRRPSDLPPPR